MAWYGRQSDGKHGRKNTGALRAYRARKREQAEARAAAATPKPPPGDCSRKARYPTLAEAEDALLTCKIARAIKGKTKRREMRVYVCRIHHCWHLTSKPDRHLQQPEGIAS